MGFVGEVHVAHDWPSVRKTYSGKRDGLLRTNRLVIGGMSLRELLRSYCVFSSFGKPDLGSLPSRRCFGSQMSR